MEKDLENYDVKPLNVDWGSLVGSKVYLTLGDVWESGIVTAYEEGTLTLIDKRGNTAYVNVSLPVKALRVYDGEEDK